MILNRSNSRIPLWAYGLLLLTLVVTGIYIGNLMKMPYDGVCHKAENDQFLITDIRDGSPADDAGLQPGDTILYISSGSGNTISYADLQESYSAGDTLSYHVSTDQTDKMISLVLDSYWSKDSWFFTILYSLIIFVCTTSLLILYSKPYEFTARLFFVYLQLFAVAHNFMVLFPGVTYNWFATIAFILSFNLFGVVLLHFHLIFPKPVTFFKSIFLAKLLKRSIITFYVIGILFGISLATLMILRNLGVIEESYTILREIKRWSIGWMGLTLFAALGASFFQFKRTQNPQINKKLGFVVISSIIGLFPLILFSIYPDYARNIAVDQDLLSGLVLTSGIVTYIMTSFIAAAIFRYRLWNIELFVRKALFYGAATIIVYGIFLILLYVVNILVINETKLVHLITLGGSIALFMIIRDYVQQLIDRFFYRESYDSARVVSEFEEKITKSYQIDELIYAIVQSLDSIFHFKSFVFVQKVDTLRYKSIYLLGVENHPVGEEFEITHEADDLLRKSKIFSTEQLGKKPDLINVSHGELVVPLIDNNLPVGFFVLGPKLSEKSYSLQDIKVILLIARRVVSLFHTAMLYQKDIDRQQMLVRERNRIAKDLHDDIGASMTRLFMLSELAKNNITDTSSMQKWLQQICDTSSYVTQELNHIVWALNPKNESFEAMIAYIRRFVFEYLEPTSITCNFKLPEELPNLGLSVEKRRNVYLCIREILNNLVKYSSASNAWISIDFNEGGFKIRVRDDGEGFDPSDKSINGNGLINMKKRMKDIGGNFDIKSSPGNGTEVVLVVTLK